MRAKTIAAWCLLLVISFSPALALFLFGPGDYSSVSHTLGQLAGLIGVTMFALTFVLATRLRFIEDMFGGLDKVYMVHGVLGATTLILLLFHPILLVVKFIPHDFHKAAIYLLPSGFWSVDFGMISLLGMILLIFITLYGKMRYHTWKFSHDFLGLVFIFAVLHIFLIRSSGARDYIFAGYYWFAAVVSIIGLVSFLYIILLRSKMANHAEYYIDSIRQQGDVFELALKPLAKPLQYQSGQFVFLRFHNDAVGNEPHPFSIASKSNDSRLKFGIKRLGDFTAELKNLKAGDKVSVEGPYGRFYGSKKDTDQLWIAGGIGITPFFGMAEDLMHDQKSTKKIDLFYTVRTGDEFIGLDNLKTIEKCCKGRFKLHLWVTKRDGYLTLDEMKKRLGSVAGKECYICGPGSLKEAMTAGLLDQGISRSMIHDERFNFK